MDCCTRSPPAEVACYLERLAVMTRAERLPSIDKITDGLNQEARLVTTIGYGRRRRLLASLQERGQGRSASICPQPKSG